MAAHDDPVAEFWDWWRQAGRERVQAGIEGDGVPEAVVEELRRRLDSIASGLTWELGPGSGAEHALVISAGGNGDLRDAVDRIHQAAPAADGDFEYRATRGARPAGVEQTVTVEGREFDLRELTFATRGDPQGGAIDVEIHHPGFRGLPEDVRANVAFIALDWLIGEAEVERWIGAIDLPDERPADARPFPELAGLRPK